jgi:FliG middle domain
VKLAIRLGIAVLGLLLIGGGGFAGWRYLHPKESGGHPKEGGGRAATKTRAEAPASETKREGQSGPRPDATPLKPPVEAAQPAPTAAHEKPPAGPPAKSTVPAPEKPATPPVAAQTGPAPRDPGQERLIRLYGGMRPKDAAAVMGQLDPALSVTILLGMQERQAAKVLAQLPPKTAADLVTRMSQIKRAPEADPATPRPRTETKS